jgi:hypothetical protein
MRGVDTLAMSTPIVASALPVLAFVLSASASSFGLAPPERPGRVCGDPAIKCSTSFPFEPHDLPFVITGAVEFREYSSAYFYAVVLKSVRAELPAGGCGFVDEKERLEAQRLLPGNKVFASRCWPDSQILYEPADQNYNFMAVYAGVARSEASRALRILKPRYPDAYIKRLRVRRGIT